MCVCDEYVSPRLPAACFPARSFRQLPMCVVLGWMIGQPLSLDFHLFETASIFMAVIIVSILIQKGSSNWLSGLMLLVSYFIVSAGYFLHHSDSTGTAALVYVFLRHTSTG